MKLLLVIFDALAVFSFVSARSPLPIQTRVINGFIAHPGQFPYQVSLQLFGIHNCGGVIISPTWILTAAHCIPPSLELEYFKIAAGIVKISETYINGEVFEVNQTIKHPEYLDCDPRLPNDIALIQLNGSLTFNDFVQPAIIPSPGDEFANVATLSGWGLAKHVPIAVYPDNLLFADLLLMSFEDCKNVTFESKVCTIQKDPGVNACMGDSGGPLTQNGIVIGLASVLTSNICDEKDTVAAFTKVSSYIDFISTHVQDL